MKRFFSFFWGLLFCIVQGIVGSSFSLVTWNLLGPNTPDVDSFKLPVDTASWNFKKGDMERLAIETEFLKNMNADVICVQECDRAFPIPMKYRLVHYQEKGSAGVGLWYNQNVVNCEEAGGKFFGITVPEKPNWKSQNACAWGVFSSKKNSSLNVLICSVHLGRSNGRSDTEIGKKIWDALAAILKDPIELYGCTSVIIAGDFNTNYEELANIGQSYVSTLFPVSFVMYQHNSWTVNGNSKFVFGKGAPALTDAQCFDPLNFEFTAIDHVMYTDETLNLDCDESYVGDFNRSYQDLGVLTAQNKVQYNKLNKKNLPLIHAQFPSDHLPIFATFEFKQSSSSKAASASGKLQKYSPEEIEELQNRAASEINVRLKDIIDHIDVMLENEVAVKKRMPDANKSNVVFWLPEGFEYFQQFSESFLIDTANYINKLIAQRRLEFNKSHKLLELALELAASL